MLKCERKEDKDKQREVVIEGREERK